MNNLILTDKEVVLLHELLDRYNNDSTYWNMLKHIPKEDRDPYDLLKIWGKLSELRYKKQGA